MDADYFHGAQHQYSQDETSLIYPLHGDTPLGNNAIVWRRQVASILDSISPSELSQNDTELSVQMSAGHFSDSLTSSSLFAMDPQSFLDSRIRESASICSSASTFSSATMCSYPTLSSAPAFGTAPSFDFMRPQINFPSSANDTPVLSLQQPYRSLSSPMCLSLGPGYFVAGKSQNLSALESKELEEFSLGPGFPTCQE